jgi:hypothetical protein
MPQTKPFMIICGVACLPSTSSSTTRQRFARSLPPALRYDRASAALFNILGFALQIKAG